MFRWIAISMALALGGFVQLTADRRAQREVARSGTTIVELSLPARRLFRCWHFVVLAAVMLFVDVERYSGRFDAEAALWLIGIIAEVVAFASLAAALLRNERTVLSRFTTEGVVDETGEFVAWSQIVRFTWIETPDLRVNLFDGRSVRSLLVPTDSRNEVARLLDDRLKHRRANAPDPRPS